MSFGGLRMSSPWKSGSAGAICSPKNAHTTQKPTTTSPISRDGDFSAWPRSSARTLPAESTLGARDRERGRDAHPLLP